MRTQLNESNSRISILESQCEVLQQSLSDQDSTVSKLNAMITSLQENAETLKKSFEEGQEKVRSCVIIARGIRMGGREFIQWFSRYCILANKVEPYVQFSK